MSEEKKTDDKKTDDLKEEEKKGSGEKNDNKTTKTVKIDTSKQEVVEKSKLDQIIKMINDKDERIAILEDAVSQGRLGLARGKRQKKDGKRVFLKIFTDKKGKDHLIVGWKSSPENRLVYSEQTGNPIGEILQANYFFHDEGETGLIDQVRVTRINNLAYAEIIKEDKETGDLELQMEDTAKWGRDPIKVNVNFVNP